MRMTLGEAEPNVFVRVSAQLHLFDAVEGVFMLQDDNVVASVIETGTWECMRLCLTCCLFQIGFL